MKRRFELGKLMLYQPSYSRSLRCGARSQQIGVSPHNLAAVPNLVTLQRR